MKKLVIDVGGTLIKYALIDDDLKMYQKGEVKTPLDSQASFVKSIVELYQQFKDETDGIALSMPGNIDSNTGYIHTPGALTYNENTNIIHALHEYIDVNISVENDGKCAALAELYYGNLQGCNNGVVLIIGTGIGGGIICNGQLVKGDDFFAGEVSFLYTDLKAKGFQKMFAYSASTSTLVRSVAKAKNIDPETIDGKVVFEMIKNNDQDAIAAFEEITDYLAGAIYNFNCILNPKKVLLGGGISKQPLLLETVNKKVNDIYASIPFNIPHTIIETTKYFNDSNLLGALANFHLMFK